MSYESNKTVHVQGGGVRLIRPTKLYMCRVVVVYTLSEQQNCTCADGDVRLMRAVKLYMCRVVVYALSDQQNCTCAGWWCTPYQTNKTVHVQGGGVHLIRATKLYMCR